MQAKKVTVSTDIERQWVRWVAYSIALVIGIMLLTLGVMTYRSYNAGMLDLGNMTQAIWSVTQGRPLEYTHQDGHLPQFSRLSWHAEFIYLLLAPFYALFPTPITLLVIQSIFFAAGAIPLYNFANRRIKNDWGALVVVTIYVFYPVAQTAMLWSFHGDTLAMPIFFFVIDELDRRNWRAYGFWLLLALSCKIYVAIPVVALGIVLWLMGQRKVGVITTFVGLLWGIIVVLLIRPIFAPPETSYAAKSLLDYLIFYFDLDIQALQTSWFIRLFVLGVVYLPVAIYTRSSFRWLLPAYAVILPVLLSNGPGPSYYYVYHHYALAVPFFLTAVVYGSEHSKKQGTVIRGTRGRISTWQLSLGFALVLTFFINVMAVNTPFNPSFWQNRGSGGHYEMNYGRTMRDVVKEEWLRDSIDSEVPLAISTLMAPHMANRHILFGSDNISEENIGLIDVAVYDALFDKTVMEDNENFLGGALYDWDKIELLLNHPEFKLVDMRDGLLLFQRTFTEVALKNDVVISYGGEDSDTFVTSFSDVIKLLSASVTPLDGQYYEVTFTWQAEENLQEMPLLFAVSRLQGVEGTRFIHLPTLVLHPTDSWLKGDIIIEVFDIKLPEDVPAGTYTLMTGWYNSISPFAFKTDERSQVGHKWPTLTITVE